MRLGRTTAVYFSSKTIGSVFGFLAMVYFGRTLGEAVLGQYALVLAVVMWAAIAGKVGVASAVKKRISEQQEPAQYLGAGVVVLLVMGIVIAGILLSISSYVNAYVGAPVAELIIILLFAAMYRSFVASSLEGHHRVHFAAPVSALRQLLRAGTQILLVMLGFGLTGLLWGYVTGYIVAATIGLWVLGLRPAVPSRQHLNGLFRYARYAWLGNVRWQTFNGFDIAILGFFVSQAFVGIYSVAWLCGQFLNFFSRAISASLFPTMSERTIKDGIQGVSELVEAGLAYAGLLLLPGFVGAIVVGDYLLAIFGDGFARGHLVLVVLVAALIVYAYFSQLLNTLNAIDRPDLAFRANAALILTNMLLNVVFIWQIGWLGAAVATAISAAAAFIVAFHYVNCCVPFHFPIREVTFQLISALCMGAVVIGFRMIVTRKYLIPEEALAIILIGSGAVVYFCFILLFSSRFRNTVYDNIIDG